MKLIVSKNHLEAQIWYRSLDPSEKTASKKKPIKQAEIKPNFLTKYSDDELTVFIPYIM